MTYEIISQGKSEICFVLFFVIIWFYSEVNDQLNLMSANQSPVVNVNANTGCYLIRYNHVV